MHATVSTGLTLQHARRSCGLTLRRAVWKPHRVQGRLLLSNWWILLLGAAFQYIHGAFTAVAYHMHEPRETLKDLGFMILPVCI